MKKNVTGVVLVAGNSTRYGKGKNKNFEKVHGKSLLHYSLKVMDSVSAIRDILIVIREEDRETVQKILKQEKLEKPVQLVVGGSSRMESVSHALEATDSSYVVIHDGARPAIKKRMIVDALRALKTFSGAVVGVPSKDTIKIVDGNGVVTSSTERDCTWCSQTPQCFDREVLWALHQKYKDCPNITDDAMLLEKEGYPVQMIRGEYTNIKVTTREDLMIVSHYL